MFEFWLFKKKIASNMIFVLVMCRCLQCKVDEFLNMTSSTLESYVDTYQDDVPQEQTDETAFILALCGIITSKSTTQRYILFVFSPFAAISRRGVVGFAETFPFFHFELSPVHFSLIFQAFMCLLSVSCHLNLGLPLFNSGTDLMFSVSSLLFTCQNHSNLLMTIDIGSTFENFLRDLLISLMFQ